MKYVGFQMPNFDFHGYDWVYDLVGEESQNKFYIINAKNADEARTKLLEKMFSQFDDWDISVRAFFGMVGYAESFDEEQVFKDFGVDSKHLLYEILCDWNEPLIEKIPENEDRLKNLSDEILKALCFSDMRVNIAISKADEIK